MGLHLTVEQSLTFPRFDFGEKLQPLIRRGRRALVVGVGTVKEFIHIKALAGQSAIVLRKSRVFAKWQEIVAICYLLSAPIPRSTGLPIAGPYRSLRA
jgi:hypothetical protein